MSANQLETQVNLERLAAVVRDEIQQARKAWSNALGHAMNAGDALIAVQPKIAARGIAWKRWLKENCFIAVSTAQLYQRLARHRDQIGAELQAEGELSLRGARQLISSAQHEDDERAGDGGEHLTDGEEDESEAENSSKSAKPESLIEHWRRTPGELTALLDAIGIENMLKAMSVEFGRQLRARLPAPKRKSDKPFKKTLNLHTRERDHSFRH